jgi:hypothetical protein
MMLYLSFRSPIPMYGSALQIASHRNGDMKYLIPHYINVDQSDLRAIKDGWYVADGEGKLVAGPFSSREESVLRGNVRFGSARDAYSGLYRNVERT